ncbi:hypothetical protein GCM10007928_02650 [Sulfitobacter porphyrae]|nr:hypothetical protein GCM10007928_02650 [Sulfitobacter porphyrae]
MSRLKETEGALPDRLLKPSGPAFLATSEIAESLAVSSRTVARMCVSGDLPAYKIGRQWRILQNDFARWMKERRNEKWLRSISVETPIGLDSSGAGKRSESPLARLLNAKPESISQNYKRNIAGST